MPRAARRCWRSAASNRSRNMSETRGLVRVFDTLGQDVRYAIRLLRRYPLFALTAALSLAVGIGANTAVFSVIDTVLLRDIRLPRPEELAVVWKGPIGGEPDSGISPAHATDLVDADAHRAHRSVHDDAIHHPGRYRWRARAGHARRLEFLPDPRSVTANGPGLRPRPTTLPAPSTWWSSATAYGNGDSARTRI